MSEGVRSAVTGTESVMGFYYLIKPKVKRLITNTTLKPVPILYNLGNIVTFSIYKFALILSYHLSMGISICLPYVSRFPHSCYLSRTFSTSAVNYAEIEARSTMA
jgi:hypothetical protein